MTEPIFQARKGLTKIELDTRAEAEACIYVASGRNIQFVAIVQYIGSRRTNRAVADFAFDTEHDVTEIDIIARRSHFLEESA